MTLDADELRLLAQNDPQEFERYRRQLIEQVICAAPEAQQARLRGLQFRIDLERQRAVTALGACIRLNTMMWDSFVMLRESLSQFADQRQSLPPRKPSELAKVISFVAHEPPTK